MSNPYPEQGQTQASASYTPEQYQAAAADIQHQAQPVTEHVQQQAAVNSEIGQEQRGPLLPAEQRIDDLMAQLRQQSDALAQMQEQMGFLQRQQEEAQAASGGPLVVRYAVGVADKLRALVDANAGRPALGARDHYAPVLEAADKLVEAAKNVSKDGGNIDQHRGLVGEIERFLDRHHTRRGGGHVDFSAIRDDLYTSQDEADKAVAR